MNGLKTLRELALQDSKVRHPSLPDEVRSTRNYNDRTANGLTQCILDFLRFSGWQAERISVSGRYVDGTKIVKDYLGRTMKIGSGKWIPGSMTRGSADISATIKGRSVKIEVKMKDRQSEDQKRYQEQVERAGGIYIIVHSMDEFIELYNKI
jgi:hypothetical protein